MSILEALKQSLPYWVGGFALVWIIFHYPQTSLLQVGMFWVGLTMIVVGFGIRMLLNLKPRETPWGNPISNSTTNLIMGLGLAIYTESLLVALLGFCTAMVWWVGHSQNELPGNPAHQMVPERARNFSQEALMGLGIIAFLVGIQQIKGLIPLQ